eukprot:TRINITY_DN1287_c0_g1_i2.p1 TRINITY_DN1287_c0_g1~~TRINITY_DN1287_c0_g1_i2.p1  ORF type:complete len:156 (-),score=51.01 TRINITY_DN1287_c0_g1_i2:50-517(-)
MNLTPEQIKNAQEEADMQHAKDLFGSIDDYRDERPAPTMANMIADYNPNTKEDFEIFAQIIADRIAPFTTSIHFRPFVTSLLKKITADLSIDDMQDISRDYNTQINSAISATKTKKGRGKKKQTVKVTVKKPTSDPFGFDGGDYDDDYYDDDDFM